MNIYFICLYAKKFLNIIMYMNVLCSEKKLLVNPFIVGTVLMLMQTGWIQASRQVTRRLT